MSKPLFVLLLSAGMLATPVSQADEIKPQTQRNSRQPTITPATTSRKLEIPTSAKSKPAENQTRSEESKNPPPPSTEESRLLQEDARNVLDQLRVKPDVADKLVKEVADPDKKEGAIDRIKGIANAAGELDAAGVDAQARDRAVDVISRSKDPKATANEVVGETATESFFGKDIAKLVPASKRGQFREIFISLLEVEGSLETLGAESDDPEVKDAIKEVAQQGISSKQEARIIMEKAAHKVFDRQGFPGKPGQSLNERLALIAEEQKVLQAELDAKKAAKAKADLLAQQRAKTRAGNIGNSPITQGAAGSTGVGRSVSSKVEVAVGGGKGNTSGAGTAQRGTGVDATKNTGTGGQNRADMASTRLAADKGGVSSAGRPTTGNNPTSDLGANNSTPPAASTPAAADSAPANIDTNNAPQSPIMDDADVNTPATNTPGTTATPGNPQANHDNPSSQVVSGGDDFLVGPTGSHTPVDVAHAQTRDGNSRSSTTYFADGTFETTTVTVTRDSHGQVSSSTETKSTGTWASDSQGNKQHTSTTSSTSTTSNSNDQSSSKNQSSSDDDDDEDDDDTNNSESPPQTEQAASEQTEEQSTSEESKEASTTPNPMDIGGGDSSQLSTSTGGRLGGQEARRQQRGLELARSGGAAGPNATDKGGSYTLLTPEEMANAERALNMRRGGGVTNPNPLGKDGVTVTDRDLKELNLRGNGGAKGPTDKASPSTPQGPRSPVGGQTPGVAPTGGTRLNASKAKSATTQRNLNGSRRIADDALKSNIRN